MKYTADFYAGDSLAMWKPRKSEVLGGQRGQDPGCSSVAWIAVWLLGKSQSLGNMALQLRRSPGISSRFESQFHLGQVTSYLWASASSARTWALVRNECYNLVKTFSMVPDTFLKLSFLICRRTIGSFMAQMFLGSTVEPALLWAACFHSQLPFYWPRDASQGFPCLFLLLWQLKHQLEGNLSPHE